MSRWFGSMSLFLWSCRKIVRRMAFVLLGRTHLARQCASGGEYYFQIHLRHLLAPFPFWRPLIPLSVALLRCVSFTLARMKNSRRICGCAKLLTGTLRCLRLDPTFPLGRFDEEQLGRCPKPHQRRRLWIRQGGMKRDEVPSLDPFRAIELFSLPLLLPRVALLGGIPIPYHFMNQVEIYPVLPSTSTLHQSVPCSSTFTSVPTGTRASTSAFSDAPFRKFT